MMILITLKKERKLIMLLKMRTLRERRAKKERRNDFKKTFHKEIIKILIIVEFIQSMNIFLKYFIYFEAAFSCGDFLFLGYTRSISSQRIIAGSKLLATCQTMLNNFLQAALSVYFSKILDGEISKTKAEH